VKTFPCLNFPPYECSPSEGCGNPWEVKSSKLTSAPILTRENPKPLGMFHPKGKLAPHDIRLLIRMVEVEGIPPPMLKRRLTPPLEEDPKVGIGIYDLGVEKLGKLTNGKDDLTGVP
jgi:hypothetical protein